MKIGINSGFHLTYCTNIHPGEEWKLVFANLEQYVPVLKARLAPGELFGIGLRLADVAARELLQGNALAQFQSWLEASQAKSALHGRCIYDGCCLLDIQHAPPSISVITLPNSKSVVVDFDCLPMEPPTSTGVHGESRGR